jgi:hypothetical protein
MKPLIIYSFLIFIISCEAKKSNTGNIVDEINIGNQSTEDYIMEKIKNGKMKKLSELEILDKEKYFSIIEFFSNEDKVDDYYFSIEINLRKTTIEYCIWYYKIFDKEHRNIPGDGTGKCFTIIFNDKNEIIDRYYWE